MKQILFYTSDGAFFGSCMADRVCYKNNSFLFTCDETEHFTEVKGWLLGYIEVIDNEPEFSRTRYDDEKIMEYNEVIL